MKVFSAMIFSVLLIGIPAVATAGVLDLFKNADQKAVELLEGGDPDAATSLFRDSQWQGVSQYRAGEYQEAMQNFSQSEDAVALYNHGTAAAHVGDYAQAVSSLEAALALAPDDINIASNLEIARKLKDIAQENEQSPSESEEGESEEQQDQDAQEQDGEEQDSAEQQEQSGENSDQSDDSQNDASQQQDGELSEQDAQQQNEPSDQESQDQDLQELRKQMQEQQQQAAENETDNDPLEAQADSSVSEDDQATQQWLRRIPDDASQLLRNKVRLNHVIEYPDVQDMQEPW